MRRLLLTATLLLNGCISTSPVTGHRKMFGFKIPFTGNADRIVDERMGMVIEQLAPLIWVAIPMIIAGVYWWWITKGNTGLGKLAVGLGVSFVVGSVLLAKYAGWIGLITLVALVGLMAFKIWDYFRKEKTPPPESEEVVAPPSD